MKKVVPNSSWMEIDDDDLLKTGTIGSPNTGTIGGSIETAPLPPTTEFKPAIPQPSAETDLVTEKVYLDELI